MARLAIEDPAEARDYLTKVEVFGVPEGLESADALTLEKPAYESDTSQAVAVGSQIAEFADNVPRAIRPQIANSFLLAQLAANRTTANGGSSKEWYDRYVEVLANVGWLVESEALSVRDVSGSSLRVHREIIPVVAAALAPGGAGAAMIMAILNGLAAMDENNPWITLFDRESQRATANQFQLSYAEAPQAAAPRISLACFELNASRSVTQVLFFKFSQTDATLRHFASQLSMNAAVFESVRAIVEQRVAEYARNYVTAIEL